jgi:hypothetical protein
MGACVPTPLWPCSFTLACAPGSASARDRSWMSPRVGRLACRACGGRQRSQASPGPGGSTPSVFTTNSWRGCNPSPAPRGSPGTYWRPCQSRWSSGRTPARQRRLASTLVVQRRICWADALLPVADHAPPTRPPGRGSPQPGAAGGGLRQPVGRHSVAPPRPLRAVTRPGGDRRGGLAPHPLGWRPVAAAGCERVEVCDPPGAMARRGGLAGVVTGLAGPDAGGQERSGRGRMPDVVAAWGGRRPGRMQGWGPVPTPAARFDQQPIEAPHHVGCPRLDHSLGGTAATCREIAGPVAARRPRAICPAPGVLQASAARPFEHRGARSRGAQAPPLGQQLALGVSPHGVCRTITWRCSVVNASRRTPGWASARASRPGDTTATAPKAPRCAPSRGRSSAGRSRRAPLLPSSGDAWVGHRLQPCGCVSCVRERTGLARVPSWG